MAVIQRQPMSPVAADAAPRGEAFASGTTIGRYRIVGLAGSGAMGDVYRAHDRVLDRDVALKVLPPSLVHDRERVRRLSQEARAASALSHPHIVTIYEVGHARPSLKVHPIAGGRPRRLEVHYIAMEYVDGRTLRESLDQPMPLERRVQLLIEVADGLTKAHGAGIIHRDLKPENIIVTSDGYAKIVDFGLAKLVDGDGLMAAIGADSPTLALTQKGEILGTPAYMSPEQVTGGTVDAGSDIFSFGCVLYELLAGRQPFEGDSSLDTLHKIVHDDPPPLPAGVHPTLAAVALRCLAKNRADRYESIREAAEELRHWLHGGRSVAPTPVRVPRSLLGAAAAVIVVLAGVVAVIHRFSAAAPAETHSIRRVTSSGRASVATISPDGRWLAYVVGDATGDKSLWLEQVETHSRLQLAAPSGSHYVGLTFSRDSNYLYFTRYDSYPYGGLMRVPILGGKPEVLVRDVDSPPAISPDGAQLAFVRDDWNKALSTLYVVNADGSGERVLASARIPHRLLVPAWSADGRRLAAIDDDKLVEIAFPSGRRRDIATRRHFHTVKGVTWTPQGSLLVSAAENAGDHLRLWRVDPLSGQCTPLTDELSNVVAPSVSADGNSIAALQLVRQTNLFVVDDGGVRQLTAAPGYGGLAWLGDHIVYSSAAEGNPDLWSIDARGGEAARLSTERSVHAMPATAPDGSLIVYRADSGRSALWAMKPDGSDRRALTPGPDDGDFAISPDSKTLAWASLDRASNEWVLWTMPLGGGPRRRLTSRRSVLDEIRFTPDGRSILFTGYEETRCTIFRIAVGGGAVTALTAKVSKDATASPDGQTVACTYSIDESGHYPAALIPIGDPAHLRTLDLKGMAYRWRDGKTLSFTRDAKGTANLWMQRIDGEAPRQLTNFNEGSIVGYEWSRDGKQAAVAHEVDSVDVVLLRQE